MRESNQWVAGAVMLGVAANWIFDSSEAFGERYVVGGWAADSKGLHMLSEDGSTTWAACSPITGSVAWPANIASGAAAQQSVSSRAPATRPARAVPAGPAGCTLPAP